MALSGSLIYSENGFDYANVTKNFAGCVLPASSLIVLQIAQINNANGDPTLAVANTGTALTWTKQKTSTNGVGSTGAFAETWTAPNTTGQTVTIQLSAGAGKGAFTSDGTASAVAITAWTGYDTSTPLGLKAESNLNGSNTGTLSYSLGGTAASSSAVVAIIACDGDHGNAVVAGGSGWTEQYKTQSGTSGWFRSTTESKAGAISTVDYGALNDPYQYASCAVEIRAAGSGGGVSVNVTGASSTSAAGTITVTGKANLTLTGTAATGAANTPTASIKASASLTGGAATSAANVPTVSGKANVSLTGVVSASSSGIPTVTGFANVSVNGVAAASSVGSVTAATAAPVSVNVTGIAATGVANIPTVTGAANVSVTGVQSASTVGVPTITGFANVPITGVFATGSAGTITVTVGGATSVNLTGVQAASAAGTPTVTGFGNVSLTGVSAASSVGSLSVTAPANASVTGVQSASAANTPTVTGVANVSPSGTTATGTAADVTVSVPTAVSVTLLGVQSNIVVGALSTNLDQPNTDGQTVLTNRRGAGGFTRREYENFLDAKRAAQAKARLLKKKTGEELREAVDLAEQVGIKAGLLGDIAPSIAPLTEALEEATLANSAQTAMQARVAIQIAEAMLRQMEDDDEEDLILMALLA
jgi:hypothetical protein